MDVFGTHLPDCSKTYSPYRLFWHLWLNAHFRQKVKPVANLNRSFDALSYWLC